MAKTKDTSKEDEYRLPGLKNASRIIKKLIPSFTVPILETLFAHEEKQDENEQSESGYVVLNRESNFIKKTTAPPSKKYIVWPEGGEGLFGKSEGFSEKRIGKGGFAFEQLKASELVPIVTVNSTISIMGPSFANSPNIKPLLTSEEENFNKIAPFEYNENNENNISTTNEPAQDNDNTTPESGNEELKFHFPENFMDFGNNAKTEDDNSAE